MKSTRYKKGDIKCPQSVALRFMDDSLPGFKKPAQSKVTAETKGVNILLKVSIVNY